MVSWPRACVGCGETDPSKLKEYEYEYRNSKLISSTYAGSYGGYNHYNNTYQVTTLGVDAWCCDPCATKARIRFLIGLVLLIISVILPLAIGGSLLAAEIEVEFELELFLWLFFLSWFFISLIGMFSWLIQRRNPSKHYHKVRKHGSSFKFIFRNQKYMDIFSQYNTGYIIKFSSWFP